MLIVSKPIKILLSGMNSIVSHLALTENWQIDRQCFATKRTFDSKLPATVNLKLKINV